MSWWQDANDGPSRGVFVSAGVPARGNGNQKRVSFGKPRNPRSAQDPEPTNCVFQRPGPGTLRRPGFPSQSTIALKHVGARWMIGDEQAQALADKVFAIETHRKSLPAWSSKSFSLRT